MSSTIGGINLPSPKFGEMRKIGKKAVKRILHDGTAVAQDLCVMEYLFLDYASLTKTDKDALVAKLLDTVGGAITVTYSDSTKTYTCILTNDVLEVVSTRPPCSYSVHLEFLVTGVS